MSFSDSIKKEAIDYYKEVLSTTKVGERIGVNRKTISKWLKKAGIPLQPIGGIKGSVHSEESKRKMTGCPKGTIAWNKGKKASEETKKKQSLIRLANPNRYWQNKKRPEMTGDKHPRWTGKTEETRLIRFSFEYNQWRKQVYERDDYTCVKCNIRGGKLNADHIKRFSEFPELRLDINNGQTLCIDCHREKTRKELITKHKNQFCSWEKLNN